MIKYFQTTTLILLWCFLLSLIISWVKFHIIYKKLNSGKKFQQQDQIILPALILGPVIMVLFYNLFGKNLIFPLHFFSSTWDLVQSAFFPGLILVCSSGLWFSLSKSIYREIEYWSQMQFFVVAKGLGKSQIKSLRKLVLIKSLTSSWGQSLPWVFGELIIVESVFNAPGLGLDAWHLARMRDMPGLTQSVFYLVVMYGVCVLISNSVSKWVGKRLESYGG